MNCEHITARFAESEIADATVVLRERIAALEAENARLRAPCRANCPKARLRYAHDSLGFRALPFVIP